MNKFSFFISVTFSSFLYSSEAINPMHMNEMIGEVGNNLSIYDQFSNRKVSKQYFDIYSGLIRNNKKVRHFLEDVLYEKVEKCNEQKKNKRKRITRSRCFDTTSSVLLPQENFFLADILFPIVLNNAQEQSFCYKDQNGEIKKLSVVFQNEYMSEKFSDNGYIQTYAVDGIQYRFSNFYVPENNIFQKYLSYTQKIVIEELPEDQIDSLSSICKIDKLVRVDISERNQIVKLMHSKEIWPIIQNMSIFVDLYENNLFQIFISDFLHPMFAEEPSDETDLKQLIKTVFDSGILSAVDTFKVKRDILNCLVKAENIDLLDIIYKSEGIHIPQKMTEILWKKSLAEDCMESFLFLCKYAVNEQTLKNCVQSPSFKNYKDTLLAILKQENMSEAIDYLNKLIEESKKVS